MNIQLLDSAPTSQKLTLLIMLIGLILCVFYVFFWEPIHSQAEMVESEIQRLQQEIQLYKTQAMTLGDLQIKVEKLERDLSGSGQILDQESAGVGVRKEVMDLAEAHRLDVVLWRPDVSVEQARDGIKATPIRVRVEGGYHQVARFLSAILQLRQVFGIHHLQMSTERDLTRKSLLRTDFILTSMETPSVAEFTKLIRSQGEQTISPTGS